MAKQAVKNYPSQYKSKVILKDGSILLFRPIRQDDAEDWLAFYNKLSKERQDQSGFSPVILLCFLSSTA